MFRMMFRQFRLNENVPLIALTKHSHKQVINCFGPNEIIDFFNEGDADLSSNIEKYALLLTSLRIDITCPRFVLAECIKSL